MTLISSGAVRLTDWGVIRAQGADAATFLNGQLTQDFALLGMDEARLAGYCNAKGRLQALMIGWKLDAETVLLALPSELLPGFLKRLSMFVLRAKCKLSDASADWALWGVVQQADAAPRWSVQRNDNVQRIRLPDASAAQSRWLQAQATSAPAPGLAPIELAEWQQLEVAAGLAWVRSATFEQFVPQMLNLEMLGGVNFKKGCYPGQEVVARSQYRGTIKRRTHLFAASAQAEVGQEIFHSADPDQPAGLVAAAAADASSDGTSLLLAEVKLAALEQGTLHLGSASGPQLQARALPYAIEALD